MTTAPPADMPTRERGRLGALARRPAEGLETLARVASRELGRAGRQARARTHARVRERPLLSELAHVRKLLASRPVGQRPAWRR